MSQKSKKQDDTLHFKIDGTFFCDLIRTKVLEGRWRSALELISHIRSEDEGGSTEDVGASILRGEKVLVGIDDGLTLEDESEDRRTEYQSELDRKFGHIIKAANHKFYVPYACVSSWCHVDLDRELKKNNKTGHLTSSINYGEKCDRSIYYMDDQVNDLVARCDIDGKSVHVLWTEFNDPPPFIKVHDGTYSQNWQIALDHYFKTGHSLDQRGAHLLPEDIRRRSQWMGVRLDIENRSAAKDEYEDEDDDEDEETATEPAKPDAAKMQALALSGMCPGLADILGMEDFQQSTLEFITGKQDTDSAPEPDDRFMSKYGYITKDGLFYPCKFHAHGALASRIFKNLYNDMTEYEDFQKAGDRAGWLRVSRSVLDGAPSMFMLGTPTDAQKTSFAAWCHAQGVELDLYVSHTEDYGG